MTASRIDRRDFLASTGAAAGAGALAASCKQHEDPYALEKPAVPGAGQWARGEERYIATACAQCSAGCGVRVRVVEGRAVKIEGNTKCPINEGGVGPRGLSGPQVLYDPDRIRTPLKRVGERGSGRLEPATWDEALAAIGGELAKLRAAGDAHRVALVCNRQRGMMLELFRRFALAYGTPNVFDGWAGADGPPALACELMQGVRELPAYDWDRARYVLSLGSGVLEASCQVVAFARAQGRMRRGRAGVRAKIVHVGPARSRTAETADEWLSIRAGTHGAFALGLGHVLVRDGLHDKQFVEQHGFGFEPWTDEAGRAHAGFRETLAAFAPEHATEICGCKPADVERIARALGDSRPCFAIGGSDEYLASNGLGAALAVHALNALLGAIDRPGGLMTQRDAPLAPWPEFEPDETAQAALGRGRFGTLAGTRFALREPPLDALPAAIAHGAPYELAALFLYYSNPLYARAQPDAWRAALARVPLVVSFTPFLDETASAAADWVLPDDSYLERFEDAAPAPSVGHAVFGMRQPVVERLYDTRSSGDALIQLAAQIGSPVQEALPWKEFKDAVKARVIGLYQSKRGSIVEDKGSGFLKRLYDEGFWSDVEYAFEQWSDVLRTPSGKFEFFSQRALATLDALAQREQVATVDALTKLGLPPDLDRACLPHHDDLAWSGDAAQYPLLLLPFRSSTYAEGSGANLPWLQELRIHAGRPTWGTEAALHPATAKELGIESGDRIAIESAHGSIQCTAWVSDAVRPEIVRVPQGGGHTAFGRFARGVGDNVMKLVSASGVHPLAGFNSLCDTRVRVRRLA